MRLQLQLTIVKKSALFLRIFPVGVMGIDFDLILLILEVKRLPLNAGLHRVADWCVHLGIASRGELELVDAPKISLVEVINLQLHL